MVGWHHWLNGHEFEQALGDGNEQGSLVCWNPWGRKDLRWLSDWTTTKILIGKSHLSHKWTGKSSFSPIMFILMSSRMHSRNVFFLPNSSSPLPSYHPLPLHSNSFSPAGDQFIVLGVWDTDCYCSPAWKWALKESILEPQGHQTIQNSEYMADHCRRQWDPCLAFG